MPLSRIVVAAILATAAGTAPALAQATAPVPGGDVRLAMRDGTVVQGHFVSWTSDTVHVDRDGTAQAIDRRQVVRWQEPVPGTRRSRWLMGLGWGALIGSVGGAAIGLAAGGSGQCNAGEWCFMADMGRAAYAVAGASMGLLVGGAAGTLIGVNLHAETWRDRPEFLRR